MDQIIPKFVAVEMDSIAMDIIDRYQEKAANKNVKLIFSNEERLPKVSGDAKHLERAFTLLVDIDEKFSLDGGDVNISLQSNGRQIIIIISDNKVGITE